MSVRGEAKSWRVMGDELNDEKRLRNAAEARLEKLIAAIRDVETRTEEQRQAGLLVNVARGHLARILNEVDQ